MSDPHEAVSPRAALRAYTIDAGLAAGLERDRGSLEAGKRADFIVLSGHPLDVALDDLITLRVAETWVAGERVFHLP